MPRRREREEREECAMPRSLMIMDGESIMGRVCPTEDDLDAMINDEELITDMIISADRRAARVREAFAASADFDLEEF
jgi:hypothetical protein